MVRGLYYYICPKCGHVFKSYDIEMNATVFSRPVHCIRCHADAIRLFPAGLFSKSPVR